MKTEPKIAILQKKGGNRSTFGIIKALLLAMNVNLHIDNSLTEANINNIAQMLTSNSELRWWLTLADIDLLCRQIVQGRFGKFYGHFSEQEFNDCLARYCNERTELHLLNNDKTVDVGDPAVLKEMGYKVDEHGNIIMLEKVGYKVDEHGDLIVSEALKKKDPFPQPMYVYDDHGRRRRNPRFHDPNENPDLKNQVRIHRRAVVIQDQQQCTWPAALAAARQEYEESRKQQNQTT